MAGTKRNSIVNVVTALNPKTRELAAVAASVAGNCIPCLRYHLTEATKNGCTTEEIREVIELATRIKQSPTDRINSVAIKYLQMR